MTQSLLHIIIAIAVLLVCWFVIERFSPDPLITKIAQIIIFIVALYVVITMILPLAGVNL